MNQGIMTKKLEQMDEYIPNNEQYSIKLDANESSYKISKKILGEFSEAINSMDFNRYPDPTAQALLEEFADYYHVNSQNLVAGNGSDELISIICGTFTDPGDTVTVLSPDFSMYEFYAKYASAKVITYKKDDRFDFDLNDLAKFVNENRSKILIFSNPCNPTGLMKNRLELMKLIRDIDSRTLIVIDEAYMDFCEEYKTQNLFEKADYFDNVIVLKTLSKAYASAAMRIGFAAANPEIISALKKAKSPYNVNSISQEFARILLKHRYDFEEKMEQVLFDRMYLGGRLDDMESPWIKQICPSFTNFYLIQFDSTEHLMSVDSHLKKNGIAVRCFKNLNSMRVTAGTEAEINQFIKCLREVIPWKRVI